MACLLYTNEQLNCNKFYFKTIHFLIKNLDELKKKFGVKPEIKEKKSQKLMKLQPLKTKIRKIYPKRRAR